MMSVHFGVMEMPAEEILVEGRIEGIGDRTSQLVEKRGGHEETVEIHAPNCGIAVSSAIDRVLSPEAGIVEHPRDMAATGYHVAHGGEKFKEHCIIDERVLEAFRKVPRHRFVDPAMSGQAYEDNALPIGVGQTISQPYVVALMTQALELRTDDKILEIGTGSGFQAAILAQFSRRVYTIERHHELAERARSLLRSMGYENIVFKVGDGTRGWPQYAPFDRIVVTAGAPDVPAAYLDQLAEGGVLVIPRGDRGVQTLEVHRKRVGEVSVSEMGGVVFVPLVGEHGWER